MRPPRHAPLRRPSLGRGAPVRSRLQQEFARQLHSGQSVWEWSYELDEEDTEWPPLCRATVRVPVVGRSFTGRWERGQRDAQSDACRLVSKFLSEAIVGTSSGVASPRM